ncbi:hypothetical protein B4109_3026 [Geobacillus stearothermophilus]|uniref:Uncharacterized protein n=2 Tax=Geobacillus stearothermophilus TaxID=1422 RepID=A0A150MVT1_GEOSE|nr:hypothetical protein B4109_3026 [Geobacillus stearothermophilus]
MAERHAKQAMMFQNKILERMRSLDPRELSPNDLIRWFDIAVKVERLSRGESTEIQKVEHDGEVKQSHEIGITNKLLADEEARDLVKRLIRKRNAVKRDSDQS